MLKEIQLFKGKEIHSDLVIPTNINFQSNLEDRVFVMTPAYAGG